MKPLYLVVEGLQSFQEKQEINFEKIGKDGIFGIFGPTGSGKSTIIDAITLALYGTIMRFNDKSTEATEKFNADAINKNSDSLKVNFKFKVGDRVFRIERVYKISPKTGRINKTAILFKVNEKDEEKIAEGHKEIYREVKENILGLTLEDFTRSVVLPQGNFSQFLKISGTEKRKMLERIFNLEKYGEELTKKANAYKKELEDKLKDIEKEIENIGFSEEDLKSREDELLKLEDEKVKLKDEKIKIDNELKEMIEIKNLEDKIESLNSQKLKLEERKEDIDELILKRDMAEKFVPIVEKIKLKNEKEDSILMLGVEIKNLENKLVKAKNMMENEEKKYKDYQKDEENLFDEKREISISEDEIEKFNEIEKELTKKIDLLSKKDNLNNDINNSNKKIEELKKELGEKEINLEKVGNEKKEFYILELLKEMGDDEKCPVCGNQLSKEHKKEILDNQHCEEEKYDWILNEFESLRQTIFDLNMDIVKENTIKDEKEKTLKEISESLVDIKEYEYTLPEVRNILKDFKERRRETERIDKNLIDIRQKVMESKEKFEQYNQKIKEQEQNFSAKNQKLNFLNEELEKVSFEIDDFLKKNGIKDSSSLDELRKMIENLGIVKERIDDYEKERTFIIKTIEENQKNLRNRKFIKNIYDFSVKRAKIMDNLLELNSQKIGENRNQISNLMKNQIQIKSKLAQKKEFIKKLDPAKEVYELLKGKKFIDFLSAGKLQTITRLASKTLQRITNGRYRINVDEKSDFSIIDNFNSSIRNPQSLSGGETFMVSLCLALALASKIQLKGKSKLEFFFLDEGFGTLDGNLLEIIFNVLENLKSHGMTVGIITHVEEIKNKIPRKLIVTPAKIGISGTTVKEI